MANKSLLYMLVLVMGFLSGCTTPGGNDTLMALLAGMGGGAGGSDELTYSTMSAVYTVGESIVPNEPTYTGPDTVLSWSVSPDMPAGLVFDTATGKISGVPTAVLTETGYTVTAALSEGSIEALLRITVNIPAPSGLSYSTPAAVYNRGESITPNTPTVTGTVTEWSVSPGMPAGLVFNTGTGEISGTPSALQSSTSYTITAANSSGSAETTITIAVVAACHAPGKVSGLAASRGTHADSVVLTWEAAANADHYRVYRSNSTTYMQVLGDVTGVTYTDTSVEPGPNTYKVVAYNVCGTAGAESDSATGYRTVTDTEFFDQAYWEIESVVEWLQSSDLTSSQPAVPGMASGQFKYTVVSLTKATLEFTNFCDYYLTVNGTITVNLNLMSMVGTATGTLTVAGIYNGYVRFGSITIDCYGDGAGTFTGGHYYVKQDGEAIETEIDGTYMP